jgi:hypothetical protein
MINISQLSNEFKWVNSKANSGLNSTNRSLLLKQKMKLQPKAKILALKATPPTFKSNHLVENKVLIEDTNPKKTHV